MSISLWNKESCTKVTRGGPFSLRMGSLCVHIPQQLGATEGVIEGDGTRPYVPKTLGFIFSTSICMIVLLYMRESAWQYYNRRALLLVTGEKFLRGSNCIHSFNVLYAVPVWL